MPPQDFENYSLELEERGEQAHQEFMPGSGEPQAVAAEGDAEDGSEGDPESESESESDFEFEHDGHDGHEAPIHQNHDDLFMYVEEIRDEFIADDEWHEDDSFGRNQEPLHPLH